MRFRRYDQGRHLGFAAIHETGVQVFNDRVFVAADGTHGDHVQTLSHLPASADDVPGSAVLIAVVGHGATPTRCSLRPGPVRAGNGLSVMSFSETGNLDSVTERLLKF